jgi:NTE family protein
MNRVNGISFSSSLLRKMRAVSFVTRLIEQGSVNSDGRRQMLIHGNRAHDEMAQLGVASKLNADWDFLRRLRDVGRAHATAGWRGNSTGCAKNRLSTSRMIFCDPAAGDATP